MILFEDLLRRGRSLVVCCVFLTSCNHSPSTPSTPVVAIQVIKVDGGADVVHSFGSTLRVAVEANVTTDSATLQVQANGGVIPAFYEAFVCVSIDGKRLAATCVRASLTANREFDVDAPGPAPGSGIGQTAAVVAFIITNSNDQSFDVGDLVPSTAVASNVTAFLAMWQ